MNSISQQILEKEIFPHISKPGRYIGVEKGSIHKEWDSAIRFAVGYPDLYEVGMSNVGIQIVYALLNRSQNALCERFFSPAFDLDALLIQKQLPLFSLESKRPLGDFDFLGFSLQHESVYTNFLNILYLSGIPFSSEERIRRTSRAFPYIFTGGPCTSNPMPLSPFVDFAIIGDAEEVMDELVEVSALFKDTPKKFLEHIAQIEGIYVPLLHNNTKRRVIKDLSKTPIDTIIPVIDTIHYRANIELMRGCPQWCRFCHATYTNKPLREKKCDLVLSQTLSVLEKTGYNEVALASLSTGSYSDIIPLATSLTQKLKDKRIKVSLPSLRVDTLDDELAQLIQNNYQVGFTIAPEAGSQRLRSIIRKDITEEDIITCVRAAIRAKTKSIKLYFMIGLPWETQDDLRAIVDLCGDVYELCSQSRTKITVSLSTFIPKPHTPFQWARMLSLNEIRERQDFFKHNLNVRNMALRWHDPQMSLVEGILTRGDRTMANAIEQAWQSGCRFDAWTEHFNFDRWTDAFSSAGISIDEQLRERNTACALPWNHIDIGVPKEFILSEYLEAKKIAGQ